MKFSQNIKYHEETVYSSVSRRLQRMLLFVIAFSSIFIIFCINYSTDVFFRRNEEQLPSTFYRDNENYAISTQGCHIPAMQPFSKMVEEYIRYPKVKPCPNANYSLLQQNGSHIRIFKDVRVMNHYKIPITHIDNIACCYSSFYRPNYIEDINSMQIDKRIKYEPCIYFSDIIEVKHEFVRVKCYINGHIIKDNFFLFVPFKNRSNDDNDNGNSRNLRDSETLKSAYNVLIIGIDNLSRLNFHRTMPKTSAYFRKHGAVELMGYNKVGDNSYPNLVPMLMGYTTEEIKTICHPIKRTTFDDCPFLWHWYKQAGYYTAFGEDSAKLGTFNYFLKGFRNTPTDYYLHPFISEAEKYAGTNKDYNVVLCMNEHYLYKILLDYIKSITDTLSDFKLFGFFWETTMSHDKMNYPMLMDDSYLHFFEQLEHSEYLDKSIILLISDHGMRWGSFRKTKQGYLEERLPLAYILMPPSFRENYSEAFNNLIYNSRQLTTPFDIHKTLLDLLDLENIRNKSIIERSNNTQLKDRGTSLFLKISEDRTCQSAGIIDQWCSCHRREPLSNTSSVIVKATDNLIKYLNLLLSGYQQCVNLSLDEILQSESIVADLKTKFKKTWKEYSVLVRVKPSGGVFEATLRNDGPDWSVIGTVSRLNMYGNQSFCVQDPRIKLYCYCNEYDNMLT